MENNNRFQVYAEVPADVYHAIEVESKAMNVSKATIVRWALSNRYGFPAPTSVYQPNNSQPTPPSNPAD